MFQLFADALCVEYSFSLTSFATDPLETVVGQEFGHLFDLLLIVVPLDRQGGDLVNAVVAGGHCQLSILFFQVRNAAIFLSQLFLHGSVKRFKLLEPCSH